MARRPNAQSARRGAAQVIHLNARIVGDGRQVASDAGLAGLGQGVGLEGVFVFE